MNIEHINITVVDIDEATRFLTTIFPSAAVRGEGTRDNGGLWRHVGSDTRYVALQCEPRANQSNRQNYVDLGINHAAFVVSDIASVTQRLNDAGYKASDMNAEEAGRTAYYYYDGSGHEWELVQYHSDDMAVRNAYEA